MSVPSLYSELGDEIIQNPGFADDYKTLQLIGNPVQRNNRSPELYRRLLESASILACSDKEDHQIIALGITGSIVEDAPDNEVIRASSELLLLRLGNFPSLQLSISRFGDLLNVLDGDDITGVPINLYMEIVGKKLANQVSIAERGVFLIDFQRRVINLLRQGKNISISAPTSAGKSFALTRYVADVLKREDKYSVVYIVPTRALIAQVQREFRSVLSKYSIDDADIFTTSWEIAGEGAKPYSKAIMVMTQERLQAVESKREKLPVDLIIVDEAQKIEEGGRGIILEESVQQIIDWNPDAQVVFISPFTENPEKLGSVFYCGDVKTVETKLSPVSQRIYQVDIARRDVDISLVSQELKRRMPVSTIQAEKAIPKTYKRKAYVAASVVRTGSTMVYCNGPADCRRTANAIAEMSDEKDVGSEVRDVTRFLKRHIHKDYFLVDYLERGVGYHYGNMPGSVRTAMESLFSGKFIDTICCTSTLMEGVNFPARNIVIYKPKTGPLPMGELPFWNLAGRAGRWMKDFCGNIYCIDMKEWKGYTPGLTRAGHRIRSSMEEVVKEKKGLIVSHLREYERQKKAENDDVEAAVTRFIINEVQKGNKEFVGQLLERDSSIDRESLREITTLVENIVPDLTIPSHLILENRSIDPRLQNDLHEHVSSMRSPPIPPHPSDHGFYDSLVEILQLTNELFRRGYHDNFIRKLAVMITQWVQETTLGEMIEKGLNYTRRESSTELTRKDVNTEIENTIAIINTYITYKTCRDISCYATILKSVIGDTDVDMKAVDNLGYYVEVGAYKPTTLTILNSGIPRTIAILMSRSMPSDIQDSDECRQLMRDRQSRIEREIPSVVLDELLV